MTTKLKTRVTHQDTLERLRDAGMAHLAGSKTKYDTLAGMKEYEALELSEADAASPLALEAFIAGVVAHNRRPRRAQKALYKLYQLRRATGDAGEYFAFQDKIKAAEGHGFSLDKLSFFQWMADINQEDLWKDTADAIAQVEKMVGPAFLNSGTLLGAVRDQSFIAHDDDVDIAVVLKAENSEDAAKEWLNVFDDMLKAGLVKKAKRRNLGVFKMHSSHTSINIDVFPAWVEGGQVFVYPHTAGELKKSDLLPLAKCPTTGLPVPKKPEAMLEVNYGAGWRESDPSFEFDWTSANRKFKTFLNGLTAEPSA